MVDVSAAVQQLVALPVAGYYTLRDSYMWLVPPGTRTPAPVITTEEVFDAWLEAGNSGRGAAHLRQRVGAAMESRLDVMSDVVDAVLAAVRAACKARGHRLDTMLPLEVSKEAGGQHDGNPDAHFPCCESRLLPFPCPGSWGWTTPGCVGSRSSRSLKHLQAAARAAHCGNAMWQASLQVLLALTHTSRRGYAHRCCLGPVGCRQGGAASMPRHVDGGNQLARQLSHV